MAKPQKKPQQTSSQHSRVISAQMTKQEKRSLAFVTISRLKSQARAAVKAVRQTRFV